MSNLKRQGIPVHFRALLFSFFADILGPASYHMNRGDSSVVYLQNR